MSGLSALVLAGPGTNRDRDVALALSLAGAEPHAVLVDELVADPSTLRRHDIVVVAGGPRIADVVHGASATLVGTAVTAAGGGVLVVIGTVVAALAAPAFVRYRITRVMREVA